MPNRDEQDVSDWLWRQAELLRLQRFDELDRDRLIAELQARADALTHRLWSGLVPLLTDPLVWAFGPEGRVAPLTQRIDAHRAALRNLLWASPRLRPKLPDAVAWAYPRARRAAAPDAGLPMTDLPQVCPWAVEVLLDDGWPAVVAQPVPQYDRDFAAWAAQQAALLRARDASALDWDHLAEEVEDLWKGAAHALSMCLYACIELCYSRERHEAYLYHWQDAAFDYQHTMLRKAVKGSPSLRTLLESMVPEVYAEERAERMAKARPPLAAEPPEACPWTFDQLLDCGFWPPEAPMRQP
jgi:hypothetical protein